MLDATSTGPRTASVSFNCWSPVGTEAKGAKDDRGATIHRATDDAERPNGYTSSREVGAARDTGEADWEPYERDGWDSRDVRGLWFGDAGGRVRVTVR